MCRCGTGTSLLAPERTFAYSSQRPGVGVGEAADSAASALGLSAGFDYLTYTTRSSTTPKVGPGGERGGGQCGLLDGHLRICF